LDSQVLGEPQILGQVSAAFEDARQRDAAGPYLTALFQAAVRTGKRARSETAISCHPSSISSVAVSYIEAMNGALGAQDILVLGAGEMAQLALKALRSRGIEKFAVANRSCQRAQALLSEDGGKFYELSQLPEGLIEADTVICATSAPHLILTQDMVATAQQARGGRPLMLVDIAMPRNVDPAAAALPGVTLVNLDALHDSLESARLAREREVPQVKEIIDEEVSAWRLFNREMQVRPVIRDLRQKAESIRLRELERTMKYLGEVDPETRKHISHLSRALVNQLLHEPTRKLREEAGQGEPAGLADAVKNLFDLAS
jgi:glutamyl-tRNA reductase